MPRPTAPERWGAAWVALGLVAALAACDNNPLPSDLAATNTAVSAVIESSPRHLDPTASYWSNDTPYTYQIYEPLYGYHYLLRPFKLMPKTAVEVVAPRYLDKDGKPLAADAPGEQVAESVYDIRIKPGILFQPHPAFAKNEQGVFR
jgi:ABC-type transport system substrate-binding protein